MKTKGTGGLGKIKVIGDLGKRSCSGVVEKQVKERTGGRQAGHVEEPHSRLWGSTVFQKERGGRMHI